MQANDLVLVQGIRDTRVETYVSPRLIEAALG